MDEARQALAAAERQAEADRAEREAQYVAARDDAINHQFYDPTVPLPNGVPDSIQWGRTRVTLPKRIADRGWSYHDTVVRALLGNSEIDRYLGYLMKRFPQRGEEVRTQGPDFANFLRHIRYVPANNIWSNNSDLTRPRPQKVAFKKGKIPLFQGNPGW